MRDALQTKSFRKGDFLLKADETCRYFYFITSGLIKLFFDNGDRNFIMAFFEERCFFTELSSFNTERPSKYMLMASEPVEVMCLPKSVIKTLCDKYHSADTLFRILNETATVRMMARISEMLEDDGKKRYENFLRNNAPLLQRISLGDLADYLGITQVSLSRIRAQY